MTAVRNGALVLAIAAALAPSGAAQAGPGDREFAAIDTHDPQGFLKAVRAGADFVKGGRGREFRVILANSGVISAIPGMVGAQRELPAAMKGAPGLRIIACSETVQLLEQANKRRMPLLPGVVKMPCKSLRNKMTVAGWQVAPGFL